MTSTKSHLQPDTRGHESVSRRFVQLPSFILPFLTSTTLRCGYWRVPESCWQLTVCHSNKPLSARSCVRPDAGARSCGFSPSVEWRLNVLCRCWLDWQLPRSERPRAAH